MTATDPVQLHSAPRLCSCVTVLALGVLLLASGFGDAQNPASHPVKPAEVEKAERVFLAGAHKVDGQDLAGAQDDFAQAAKLDPSRKEYGLAFTMVRSQRVSDLVQRAAKARMLSHPEQAAELLASAKAIDPENELVLEHSLDGRGLADNNRFKVTVNNHEVVYAAPIQLAPDPNRRDLHLKGDARQALTQAAAAFGVKLSFDESVQSVPMPALRFDVEKTTYAEAMPTLLKMEHLFGVAIDKKTLLVARESMENRARFDRQVEETIYVPGSTQEQLNELTNIVRNVFDVKQVAIGLSSGTLIVRAPAAAIEAINETLKDLIDGTAEVSIDVKLIAVDRSRTINTGTQTPTSAGAFSVAGEASSIVAANQQLVSTLISSGGYVPTGNTTTDTIYEALYLVLSGAVTDTKVSGLIATAGHGLSLAGIYLGSGATINLGVNSSDTRALDDINVRVGDRTTSTLRIGQRYPITTATYSSGVSSAASSALSGITVNGVSASSLLNQYLGSGSTATIPQIEYEDLGLTLKTTPIVQKSGLIDMKIELKIESLTGVSSNNIPVLTSRSFVSDLTVPDGTSAVMISDLSRTETASITGLPGLADLPGFQLSAADRLKESNSSELVLLVTPHVVRHRPNLTASRMIPFTLTTPADY